MILRHFLKARLIGTIPILTSIGFNELPAQTTSSSSPDRIAATADQICPLKVGATIPNVSLRSIDGNSIELANLVKQKPSVVIFYRGGWCPFCNMQLKQLKDVEPELNRLGYQLLAISPDKPEKLSESLGKHSLNYTLISDSKMEAAKSFGVAFRVDENVVDRYKQNNMDLEAAAGENHHLLPVPSVFIAGTDGIIKFTYANPNYRVRIDPELLLAAAKTALKKSAP